MKFVMRLSGKYFLHNNLELQTSANACRRFRIYSRKGKGSRHCLARITNFPMCPCGPRHNNFNLKYFYCDCFNFSPLLLPLKLLLKLLLPLKLLKTKQYLCRVPGFASTRYSVTAPGVLPMSYTHHYNNIFKEQCIVFVFLKYLLTFLCIIVHQVQCTLILQFLKKNSQYVNIPTIFPVLSRFRFCVISQSSEKSQAKTTTIFLPFSLFIVDLQSIVSENGL